MLMLMLCFVCPCLGNDLIGFTCAPPVHVNPALFPVPCQVVFATCVQALLYPSSDFEFDVAWTSPSPLPSLLAWLSIAVFEPFSFGLKEFFMYFLPWLFLPQHLGNLSTSKQDISVVHTVMLGDRRTNYSKLHYSSGANSSHSSSTIASQYNRITEPMNPIMTHGVVVGNPNMMCSGTLWTLNRSTLFFPNKVSFTVQLKSQLCWVCALS